MLKQRARILRLNQTEAEKRLWKHLRNRQLQGFKFYRQYAVAPYIVDFVCRDVGLIVELDGGQHAGSTNDLARTEYLKAQGYKVVRFWNNDVLRNTEGVLLGIAETLKALTPTLSLKGEGVSEAAHG
jgi:very-short-patch-repair endonuclease